MLSRFTSSNFKLDNVNFGTRLNSPLCTMPTVARPFPRLFPLTTKLSKVISLFLTENFTFSNSEFFDFVIYVTILLENITPKSSITKAINIRLNKYFKIFTKNLLLRYDKTF